MVRILDWLIIVSCVVFIGSIAALSLRSGVPVPLKLYAFPVVIMLSSAAHLYFNYLHDRLRK
ncbi:hypothetical protein [Catenuloplanes japonicus]|uniref:hypothetical protein n=1 Tax=Catenuloplanes japonicus TaxID=33876 RepID=UPI00052744D4|nr:hypothetical protein [Catenuloplanes japonicus]